MKHYVLQDLNDPTKLKIEQRSSSSGTICEISADLVGKEFILSQDEDGNFSASLNESEQSAKEYAKDKSDKISAAYKSMSDDIYSKMLQLFQTSKSDSAVAFHEQYKLMSSSPYLFSSEGLKSDREIRDSGNNIVLLKGQDLNEDSEIEAYANHLLSEVASYSVYRIKRIEQFRAEKKAVEEE